MRKKSKRDIKKIIETMLEAHNHIMELLKSKRIADANNLLAQCQECAMHIGNVIEKNEGMDTQAVLYLEEYCEQLYRMSKNTAKKYINKCKRQMDDSLHHVEYEVDQKFKISKLKIVFMPYKISMWDCMESVWEAATADDECETFVVPIPYYERDIQGNIEKLCYEGSLFPDYIPIISYKEFSLETELPDIIYIHNPFDGANYVTSVHPDFYSSKLKQYTENLVYIPYFIIGNGVMPETHRNLPAYKNINKIIVQDEDKKESLLDYVFEDKIAVLGSPKVDKLLKLNKKKEEVLKYEIPLEWKKKIAEKKVILFNVSITGILQNSKYAFAKIRYVLDIFQNRNDVVLLWRPHPLVEATLKSMRPGMYEEYVQIKKVFVHRDNGILDQSEDAGISAVIADAYLGESTSSLVHYFGVLEKPVLFIDWKISKDICLDRNFLYFHSFFREENEIYFVPSNEGSILDLYKLDLDKGLINKVMEFPGKVSNTVLGYGIKKVKNKIILYPFNAEDIYIYDIDKKQAIKIVLSASRNCTGLFGEAIEFNGYIFLKPTYYPAIVKIDIQSFEVCEFKECVRPFLQVNGRNRILFSWSYVKKDHYLYLASCNDSRMLIFNMKDGSFEIKNIGDYKYGYFNIIYDGEYFWLAAYQANSVVRWNEIDGEVREYIYPITKELAMEKVTSSLIDNKNEIIVCYGFDTDMIVIDKETGEYKQKTEIQNALAKLQKEKIGNSEGFLYAKYLNEEKVLLFNYGNSSVNIWNLNTNEWEIIPIRFPKSEMLSVEKWKMEKYCLQKSVPYHFVESTVAIPQFIDYIVCGDTNVFKQKYECYKAQGNVGEEVHEYIKNEL